MARYELLERIGMGGMAEIFRGKAVAGGGFEKPVAIKRILPHLSQDQRFIELLIAEAKILSELHHRNIVQIYDVGLGDDSQYFLVMEFVDGTDLKLVYEHLFDGRRLPVEVALHICSEICEALEHAHLAKDAMGNSLGLVHRDVSPSNVLLSRSGEVKLTDFGIAKRVEEATGHGGVKGKFAYISPEQAVNQHVDARSDVYSVGILLYELVCGQRLFSGLADFDALREVRQGRVRPRAEHIAGVPAELAGIIMKALNKEPESRFQSAGAFGSALRGYRYSLETEIADPAAEIAALVAREGRNPSEEEEHAAEGDFTRGGSTVVRIDTAAEFNLTDLSGLHQLVTSFPPPRIGAQDDFDDMKTENLSASDLALGLAGRPGLDTGASADDELLENEKTVARKNPLLDGPRGHNPSAPPFLGRAPSPSFDEVFAPPGGGSLPPVAGGARVAPLRPPGPKLARAATPTEKDVFHAPPLPLGIETQIPNHYPGYAGRPPGFLEAEAEQRRRRLRLALIAGTLAVTAFLIAGHFLGGSASRASTALEADAGAAVDGGEAEVLEQGDAGPELTPDAGARPAQKNKRKRRIKRRRTKRKRNTGSNNKRGKRRDR